MIKVHDEYTLIMDVPNEVFGCFLWELITREVHYTITDLTDKNGFSFEITYESGEPDNSAELQKILKTLITKFKK